MGDTGSLFIGAAVGVLALLENVDLLLPLIGGLYVIETLSVIAQVASYRLFGRRIFKMAPVHHHFELARLARDHGDCPVLDPGRAVHGRVPGGVLCRLPRPWRHGLMVNAGPPPGEGLSTGQGTRHRLRPLRSRRGGLLARIRAGKWSSSKTTSERQGRPGRRRRGWRHGRDGSRAGRSAELARASGLVVPSPGVRVEPPRRMPPPSLRA